MNSSSYDLLNSFLCLAMSIRARSNLLLFDLARTIKFEKSIEKQTSIEMVSAWLETCTIFDLIYSASTENIPMKRLLFIISQTDKNSIRSYQEILTRYAILEKFAQGA